MPTQAVKNGFLSQIIENDAKQWSNDLISLLIIDQLCGTID